MQDRCTYRHGFPVLSYLRKGGVKSIARVRNVVDEQYPSIGDRQGQRIRNRRQFLFSGAMIVLDLRLTRFMRPP